MTDSPDRRPAGAARDGAEPEPGGPLRVFIGGCERSGTTFLAAQVSRWTGLTFLPESYFLLQVLRRVESNPSADIRKLILREWRLKAWNLPEADLQRLIESAEDQAQPVMDLLAQRYTESLGVDHCSGWIEHTPFNTSHVSLLDRHFSDHRYINVIRDGRAVAASILRMDFGPTTARGAAIWWQRHVLPGLLAHLRHPDRVLQVHYEELVRDPDTTRTRVLEFLDLDPVDNEVVPVRLDALFRGTHDLVTAPPDATRLEAWREQLTPDQVQIIESVAGGTLEGLGYALTKDRAAAPRRMLRYVDPVIDSLRQLCWQLPLRLIHRRGGTFFRNR